MQNIYVKTYFPKQRSVALTVAMGLVLTLVYLLSDSTEASGATVSASGESCTQTVGSSTGVSVAVVNGKCVVTFANVGTTTWTVPTGVSSVRTLVVGGGGGGGGGGSNWMYPRGGGGGGVVDNAATVVTAGATLNIIVGAGGVRAVDRVGDVLGSIPLTVTTTGGQGGSSKFGTATAVIGGYSSPAGTSAGGTSGNGYVGSGSAGAGNTMNSWSGGGGGGAGGLGTQNVIGSNWECGGGLLGNGGPGLISDITGVSIYHGGGGAGAGCYGTGRGLSTGGGAYYISNWVSSGTNYNGSYGGGGMDTTGGAGVVIISYIPVAARLIGNGGTMKTYTGTGGCTGGMRGMATDGTYVYFRTPSSASNICIANLSTGAFVRVQAVSGSALSSLPIESNALTYSSGCIFVRTSISAESTVHCIDTTSWVMSSAITPTGGTIPAGGYWLSGNLMNFPDGRVGAVAGKNSIVSTGGAASGANVCPTGSYCKILRTYTVTRSGGTASLAFSEDFTLVDPNPGWPNDDHGMATDGTYLYQIMAENGYKVWALKSGTPSPIIFDGAGTGACTAPTGISGSMCVIYKPISAASLDNFGATNADNATYLGRSHSTNQYIMGAHEADKFWVSDAVAPPTGPGSCLVDSGYTNCQLFSYTGSNQSFTFPSNISGTQEILVELWGAGGGGTEVYWYLDEGGGAGGFTKARISGTANEVLTVVVGEGGLAKDATAQYGGGGPGGPSGSGGSGGSVVGSSGGGYSGIFSGAGTATPIVISGGGGGTSAGTGYPGIDNPGGGGGANQNGGMSSGSNADGTSASMAGRGGTSSAGGAGATGNATCDTTSSASKNGSSLLGGAGCGSTTSKNEAGGGGGGGYFGGGGGAGQVIGGVANGGGGGGSGYLNLTRATLITAVAGGNGVATLFAYPDLTSIRYANNAGRGGLMNTNTTANNSGGHGYITIQWKVATSTAPGAPTIGVATATGATTATVAFTAPASDGGATITSYTATSSPAGGTGTLSQAGSGTISVTGLTAGVAYTFTVTATNSAGTSAASAASNSITPISVSTITVPEATYVSASATTNITGLSVGGLAAGSTYQVALALSPIPTGASLKLPTTTGLTASYGFTSGNPNTFSSFTAITFTGLLADVNTALALLQYVSGAATGSPVVQVTVSSLDTNYALNGYNGHFYVSSTTLNLANATYTNARATAKTQSYRGLTGYLTTITSAGENEFITNNIVNAVSIWIGATDETYSTGKEGRWRWDAQGGSPEAGLRFFDQTGTLDGSATCGRNGGVNYTADGLNYSQWASSEPNDYCSSGEDYAVTNWGGTGVSGGTWNDCPDNGCGANRAYVIEFGTSATDGGFVNSSSNLASSSFSLFYATSGQLPTVLTVDPQSSSRYLPTTLNTVGPTNLLLCLNESDASGNNLASPTINFDVAANGGSATTAGSGTSTISGDRTTATYIYGTAANAITTLNSVLGIQIYLSSGTFSATKYIKMRAISIASSSSIGSKTCSSTVYTSQNIEIRPLVLERTMKKGTITLKQ